jgi:hypothetical protein
MSLRIQAFLKSGVLHAAAFVALFALLPGSAVWAGVLNLPHFVEPDHFALGLEPEVVLSHGAGVGINARYTHGLNDLMNVQAILGTGSGPRRFRVGGNLSFDFIPDVEGQPGLGLAVQGLYVRLPDAGRFELTAIPYIHKAFPASDSEAVEPFFAFPVGWGFSEGSYQGISQAVIGALFKKSESIQWVTEVGINVNRSETYVSGGVVFFH